MIKKSTIIALLIAIVAMPVTAFAKKKKTKEKEDKILVVEQVVVEEKDIPITNYMEQLNGEWNVQEIRQNEVNLPRGSRAYLYFDVQGGAIYGNTGTNSLNALYSINGNKISITDVITTKMNGGYFQNVEKDLLRALADVNTVALTQVGETEYMELKNKHRDVLVKLRRQNLDFMNGPWLVKKINDMNVADRDIKMVNDVDMLTVNITSGCNIINGVITIDPMKEWAIEYEDLKSSHNQCPNIDTETRLLIALEETLYCRKSSATEVELYTKETDDMGNIVDKPLVVLEKVRI
jgi:heat shock protein HslJ